MTSMYQVEGSVELCIVDLDVPIFSNIFSI